MKWLPKIVDTLGSRDFLVRALILAAKPFESLSFGKEKEMLVSALPKYLDTEEARDYLLKIFDHYPLYAADALAKIGNRSDLEFILNKLASYKGPGRASINKSVKKLGKRMLENGL